MNEEKNNQNTTEQAVNYTACRAPVLIYIRYCSWGGHPKDRWMWEGIVAHGGDGLEVGHGWDYGSTTRCCIYANIWLEDHVFHCGYSITVYSDFMEIFT